MRIGIDARKIADTGIGRYIENLIRALLEAERENSYVLFMAPEQINAYSFASERVEKSPTTAGKYSVSEHWALGLLARRSGVEVFHEPHFTLPLYTPCRKVVTIHDIIHLLDPAVGAMEKTYARWMISSAIRRADQVITVSHHTKQNLVRMMGANPDKITVTHNAAGSGFAPMDGAEVATELSRLGMVSGYYLFVGSDRTHKNIKAVAGAMSMMSQDARFAIVGRMGPAARELFAPYSGRVTFIERAGTRTIAALYAGAEALFFPSYMEGFGLPPLEAMACGVPVVSSNLSSMPEVVGDAAALAHPDDHKTAAELMERIRVDQAFRAGLVERGFRRAAEFSWNKLAMQTLEVYRKAAE